MSLEQLSFMEKLQVLFSNILAHPLFLIILLMPVVLLLLRKRHGKKIFIGVYLLVIIFVLFIGNEVIFELFDNMMDGLFMTLYFPNFITLFVVVVLCSIIALVSFFDKKMYRINKIINITGFAIVQFMFVLILTTVRSNNIDIYADNALYSNSDVLTLMQLLMGAFALQIISILIINGINKVTAILDKNPNKKNIFSRIKKVKIDDSKIGYINVVDTKNPKKTKLKPFSFDLDKIEEVSVKSSKGESPNIFESKPAFAVDVFNEKPVLEDTSLNVSNNKLETDNKVSEEIKDTSKVENVLDKPKKKPSKKGKKKNNKKIEQKNNKQKITGEILTKEILNKIKEVEGLGGLTSSVSQTMDVLPKETKLVKPEIRKIEKKKDDLEKTETPVKPVVSTESVIKEIVPPVSTEPVIKEIVPPVSNDNLVKPDLMKPMEDFNNHEGYNSKFINKANTLAQEMFETAKPEPVRAYSIDNLDIINMQLTLDTVIKYKFQRGVKLRRYDESPTIDDLNIFDFDKLMRILPKSKVYRKMGK